MEQQDELTRTVESAVRVGRLRLSSDEYWDEIFPLLESAKAFGQSAIDSGVSLLAGNEAERRVGYDLLGVICNPDVEHRGHFVAVAIVTAAQHETESVLCDALVTALSHAADPVGLPTLINLAAHPDVEVRRSVASAIPFCVESDTAPGEEVAKVLIELSSDDAPDVRDMATFSLGQMLKVDSLEIRDALALRLLDTDDDTRSEALIALARRRDARTISVIISRLASGHDDLLLLESAAYMADPRFLPLLRALNVKDDVTSGYLAKALRACDPLEVDYEIATMSEVLEGIWKNVQSASEICTFGIEGERFSLDYQLTTSGPDLQENWWDFRSLFERFGGSVDAVVSSVLETMSQGGGD